MRKKYITLKEVERKYTELSENQKNYIMVPSYKEDGTALIVEKVCNDEGVVLAYFRYMANASGKAISDVTNSIYPKEPDTAEFFNSVGSVEFKKILLERLKEKLENKKEENAEMVR